MVRPLSALYGLLLLVAPQRVIDFWEPIAFENTEDAELRTGIVTVARLEGFALLVSGLRDSDSSRLQSVLGMFGMAALLAPRQYLDFGMDLAYENSDDITVKSWVVPLTRVFGFVFVFNALRSISASGSEESERERVVEA